MGTPEKTGSVLIVEDEVHERELMRRMLSKGGFTAIHEAEHGQDALERLEKLQEPPDLIVSDLRMPVMNGFKLAEHNFRNFGIPFVACTAISDCNAAINLMEYGVKDFLVKPIEMNRFIRTVSAAIQRNVISSLGMRREEHLDGNLSSIEISSSRAQLLLALDWVRNKTNGLFSGPEQSHFLNFSNEFLINAFEHGSLKMTERDKCRLLNDGIYDKEIKRREAGCAARIKIDIAILDGRIALRISDEGHGFDYAKYLSMDEDALLEKLEQPNGRGIHISTRYFDSIGYTRNGSTVTLIKSIARA